LLRTPARNLLHLPNIGLAYAIASEWDAQTDVKIGIIKYILYLRYYLIYISLSLSPIQGIEPITMPMMTLASTAIDQVLIDPNYCKSTCLNYLPTDSALFFTSESDRILLKKQKQHLQPILRWFKRTFDIELKTKSDMFGKIEHHEEVTNKFVNMLNEMVIYYNYIFI
jgi:chaperone required for assembly of F1-ATPase